MEKPKLIFNQDLCTGCRSCQMACSLHLAGVFGPEESCFEIVQDKETGIVTRKFDNDKCDLCKDETIPMCIRICPRHVIQLNQ